MDKKNIKLIALAFMLLASTSEGKVVTEYEKILRNNPGDLRTRLKYAESLLDQEKYIESKKQLEIILQNAPNNILARVSLAKCFIQEENQLEAINQLKKVLNIQPNHKKAKELLASLDSSYAEKIKEEVKEEPQKAPKIEPKEDSNKEEPEVKEKTPIPVKDEIIEPVLAQKEEPKEEMDFTLMSEYQEKAKTPTTPQVSLDDSAEKMTFTPYIAGQTKKNQVVIAQPKPQMPHAKENIKKTDMKSFFAAGKDSFIVNLEKARYEIEKGDLKEAEKTINKAEILASKLQSNKSLIDIEIFKSLLYVYQCQFTKFGKLIMSLKSAMSAESYQSFLDIYASSSELKEDFDKRRLAAGVAMGAHHDKVAASLLEPVFEKNFKEIGLGKMLYEAQLGCLDYKGAGETLQKIADTYPENPEAQFDLARFYLTGVYKPDLARAYATKAGTLNPLDNRVGIILGLIDYSEGKIDQGIKQIEELLPKVEDSSLMAICTRLIQQGKSAKNNSKDFLKILALPGSDQAAKSSFKIIGEECILSGSYFSAIEYFAKASEWAEVGRTYLGIASALVAANEIEMASIAAGYGVKIIKDTMGKGNNLSKACLYLALYYYEVKEKESCLSFVDIGLNAKGLDQSTYNKLMTLYERLK